MLAISESGCKITTFHTKDKTKTDIYALLQSDSKNAGISSQKGI